VDWTSHPAKAEDLLTREYTLICDLLSNDKSQLKHKIMLNQIYELLKLI